MTYTHNMLTRLLLADPEGMREQVENALTWVEELPSTPEAIVQALRDYGSKEETLHTLKVAVASAVVLAVAYKEKRSPAGVN